MSEKLLVDIIGWIGAGAILIAYALVSAKKVEGVSWTYQGLNLVGGIALAANSVYYKAFPSAALNVIWGIIAIFTLFTLLRRRNEPTTKEA